MSDGMTPYDCPTCGSRGLRISGHWNPLRWQVECLRGHVVEPMLGAVIVIDTSQGHITAEGEPR